MDSTATPDLSPNDFSTAVNAVLAQVTVSWDDPQAGKTTAAVLHSAREMLVLEATDPKVTLPAVGTQVVVLKSDRQKLNGRIAEHGRTGRVLISLGERPVRRALRLKVSLPGTVRSPELDGSRTVEIVDLTTGGARLRGVELPVGSQLSLGFTPPYRDEPVSVRAVVAHGTHRAQQPWVGVVFRLVALRGGR